MQIQNRGVNDLIQSLSPRNLGRKYFTGKMDRPGAVRPVPRPNVEVKSADLSKPKPVDLSKPKLAEIAVSHRPGAMADVDRFSGQRPVNFVDRPAPGSGRSPVAEIAPAQRPTDPPQPQSLTLQGLMDAWGQSDSQYDFNSDGTVNVNDLLFFINHWDKFNPNSPTDVASSAAASASGGAPGGATGGAPIPEPAPSDIAADIAPTPAPVIPIDPPTVALANVMYDHLSGAGFQARPPENIHELVDAMNLKPQTSNQMLRQMAEKYPDGLGVNMVG